MGGQLLVFEMRIGFDLDNTIICYDDCFAELGKEILTDSNEKLFSKTTLKRYLHDLNRHEDFTKIQGKAYGEYIHLAQIYDGFLPFLYELKLNGHECFIISHKTKYPISGSKFNLHEASMNFLKKRDIVNQKGIIETDVFFEQSIDKKIQKISDLKLDYFFDDLDKIFNHPLFPAYTKKYLFSPTELSATKLNTNVFKSWGELNFRDIS